jgi:hypothetical protein
VQDTSMAANVENQDSLDERIDGCHISDIRTLAADSRRHGRLVCFQTLMRIEIVAKGQDEDVKLKEMAFNG